MSIKHPIISITGSSGAGTTSVKNIFEQIFRREGITAATIEGDSLHRYDRAAMKAKVAAEEAAGNPNFTHFHGDANEIEILLPLGSCRIQLHLADCVRLNAWLGIDPHVVHHRSAQKRTGLHGCTARARRTHDGLHHPRLCRR
jgi:hypothetical protein